MNYSPFRHTGSIFLKHRPIHLTVFLTRRCNARCPFCFYLSGSRAAMAEKDELGLAELERVADSLGPLLWLAFSGGEIFLRRDLADIVALFYRRNRPAIILLPTNGLLTETIAEQIETILNRCPRSNIVVKLSLDGPEHLHDTLRGVPSSFRKTLATYEKLVPFLDRYPHFELGVNTVFCRANQDHMDEVIDFAATLDRIGTHTISLVRGEVGDPLLTDIDLGKYEAAIRRLEKDLKSKRGAVYGFAGARLKAAQDILQRRLIHRTAEQKSSLIPCYAGRLNLVLTEHGDLYPCETFTETMRLGNLRDEEMDLKRLLAGDRARQVLAMIRKRRCWCTHECYFMTNILFNPRLYPALLKEFLQCA